MKRVAVALAAVLFAAPPVAAQDFAGPVAAAIDQVGQGLGESMTGGPGIFVTAQGRAPLPAGVAAPMVLTLKGEGKTAVDAARERDALLDRVRAVARRFGVEAEVGPTGFSISEAVDYGEMAWTTDSPAVDAGMAAGEAAALIEQAAAAVDMDAPPPEPVVTVSASVMVNIERPSEDRLPAFVDALAEAGVKNLGDTLNGMGMLGQWQPFLSLLGLDTARDPGEPVWNAATADGVVRARAQAEAIAAASGRRLGQVRYVSVLMRSHDGRDALVSVAVRFGFE